MRAVLEDHVCKSVVKEMVINRRELTSHMETTLQSNLGQNSPKPECRLLAVCHLSVESPRFSRLYQSLWATVSQHSKRQWKSSTTLSTVQEQKNQLEHGDSHHRQARLHHI